MKDEYFDTIHQEGFAKDFESEYSDILHDESLGNKDSKIGPTLAPKEVREKEKKTWCQDTYFEKIHHKSNCNESFGTEDHESGSTLTLKESRPKEKGDKVGEHRQHDLAARFEARLEKLKICSLCASSVRVTHDREKCINKGKHNKDSSLNSTLEEVVGPN